MDKEIRDAVKAIEAEYAANKLPRTTAEAVAPTVVETWTAKPPPQAVVRATTPRPQGFVKWYWVPSACGGPQNARKLGDVAKHALLLEDALRGTEPLGYLKCRSLFGERIADAFADVSVFLVGGDQLPGDRQPYAGFKRRWITRNMGIGVAIRAHDPHDKTEMGDGAWGDALFYASVSLDDCMNQFHNMNIDVARVSVSTPWKWAAGENKPERQVAVRVLDLADRSAAAKLLVAACFDAVDFIYDSDKVSGEKKAETKDKILTAEDATHIFARLCEVPPRSATKKEGFSLSTGDFNIRLRTTNDATGEVALLKRDLVFLSLLRVVCDYAGLDFAALAEEAISAGKYVAPDVASALYFERGADARFARLAEFVRRGHARCLPAAFDILDGSPAMPGAAAIRVAPAPPAGWKEKERAAAAVGENVGDDDVLECTMCGCENADERTCDRCGESVCSEECFIGHRCRK